MSSSSNWFYLAVSIRMFGGEHDAFSWRCQKLEEIRFPVRSLRAESLKKGPSLSDMRICSQLKLFFTSLTHLAWFFGSLSRRRGFYMKLFALLPHRYLMLLFGLLTFQKSTRLDSHLWVIEVWHKKCCYWSNDFIQNYVLSTPLRTRLWLQEHLFRCFFFRYKWSILWFAFWIIRLQSLSSAHF